MKPVTMRGAAIQLDSVIHHYGAQPVLKGVSLEIARGEVVAVMGPNGMGKSTLLGVIAGALAPYRGRVLIDGEVRRSSEETELAIRKKVVYLPDHPFLPKERTGREFLVAAGKVYGVEHLRLMDHVERLLDVFDLSDAGGSPIRSLSNGQQKKIAVCSAFITEAPVMILDEPFSGGLDPPGILVLKQLIGSLAKRDDVTIVLATQVPELVEGIADRILILRDGEIAAFDTIASLRARADGVASLSDILERLVNPQTSGKLNRYFGGTPS